MIDSIGFLIFILSIFILGILTYMGFIVLCFMIANIK